MLIAIEGVSAAGKTTRASRYAPAVLGEITGTPPPGDLEQIGEYWTDQHARRWRQGLELETEHSVVCFDTDPLKLHYAWCLWQIGKGHRDEWLATIRATRQRLLKQEIGFVDAVLFLDPEPATLRRQKETDSSRQRRNFELHLQLLEPLRRWYTLLETLAPGRVLFNAHQSADIPLATPRPDRYSVDLFDELLNAADQPPH